MDSTYNLLASIAQSMGVLYFMALFLEIVAYALWPSNKARFDEAARMPLRED